MKIFRLLVILTTLLLSAQCFSYSKTYEYSPESIVYYPRLNGYIVANLGYEDGNESANWGHISLMYKGQIYGGYEKGTVPNKDISNPKGLYLDGDILYFCDLNILWGVNLLNFDVVYKMKINTDVYKPSLSGLCKTNNIIYLTDNLNNTIYKVNLADSSFIDLELSNKIIAPRSIIYDKELKKLVFVTQEKNSRIFSLDPDNDSLELIKTTSIDSLYGITKDNNGNYYVSSWGIAKKGDSKVYKFTNGFLNEPSVIEDSLTKAGALYYNGVLDEIAIPEMTFEMRTDDLFKFLSFAPLPAVPELWYPTENQSEVETSPEIQWKKQGKVLYYILQISDSSHFPSKSTGTALTINNYFQTSSLKENSLHYWRVKAFNHTGESDWSVTRSFTTGVKQLLAPISDTINKGFTPVSVLPTFSWHSNGADSYNLQIFKEKYVFQKKYDNPDVIPDVTDPDFSFENITDTVYTMQTALNEGTDYYWRVRGIKNSHPSQWSLTQLFRTEGFLSIDDDIQDDGKLLITNNLIENTSMINISLGYESSVYVELINATSMNRIILYNEKSLSNEYSIQMPNLQLSSGIYFIIVKSNREVLYKKIAFIK